MNLIFLMFFGVRDGGWKVMWKVGGRWMEGGWKMDGRWVEDGWKVGGRWVEGGESLERKKMFWNDFEFLTTTRPRDYTKLIFLSVKN